MDIDNKTKRALENMNMSEISAKRTEILYSRITAANKAFVTYSAETQGVSESALVNYILTVVRTTNQTFTK